MLKKIVYSVVLFSAVLVVSCGSATETEAVEFQEIKVVAEDISVEQFKSKISEESIILDVRRPIEYQAGHVANAVNIDFFSPNFLSEVSKLDKSKKILIYCASGGRSAGAMKKMGNTGFVEMYNMMGGFGAWKNANFEYVK